MAVKKCIVSYKDQDGFKHAVEVDAETLYEAATVAAKSFADHGYPPGLVSELEIEVKVPGVVHTVSLKRVQSWVHATPKSPKEKLLKDRLKVMLAGLRFLRRLGVVCRWATG